MMLGDLVPFTITGKVLHSQFVSIMIIMPITWLANNFANVLSLKTTRKRILMVHKAGMNLKKSSEKGKTADN